MFIKSHLKLLMQDWIDLNTKITLNFQSDFNNQKQAFVSFRERYHKKALKRLMFINDIYFNRKVVNLILKKYIFHQICQNKKCRK